MSSLRKNQAEREHNHRSNLSKYKKGDDFSLVSDLLGDPNLVKELIPKNMGELFDMAEQIVPGMKALQAPIEHTWSLLHPVLLVNRCWPDI